MATILASEFVTMQELKVAPNKVISKSHDNPVAVCKHGKPVAYLISTEDMTLLNEYKQLEAEEDKELADIARERIQQGGYVSVRLQDI